MEKENGHLSEKVLNNVFSKISTHTLLARLSKKLKAEYYYSGLT